MELIEKAALITEIKRRVKEHHSGYKNALLDILSFLDTLEVKEKDVDFEEEIDVCFRKKKMDTTVYLFVKKKIFQL